MAELYPVMEHDPPFPPRERTRLLLLAFAIAGPPILWATQVLVLSSFSNYACYPGDMPETGPIPSMQWIGGLQFSVHAAAVLVALASGWIAWTHLADARARISAQANDSLARWHLDRRCFLALAGLFYSGGFFAAIVFEIIASLMVRPCGA